MPGSRMSMRITSGRCSSASWIASSPLLASSVRNPANRRTSRASFTFFSLSSTMRISSPAITRSLRRADRKREAEGAPRPRLALHPQATAVQLDEPPRQRQPEPGALAAPRRGIPSLLELFEDALLILGSDPPPPIRLHLG